MYKHRLPQRLILLASLLLCVIGTPELLHSADDTEQSGSEKATANNEAENNTTEPHYYIRQLRFDGNKHLNEKRLTTLFEWQAEKAYSQTEIREGFERILDTYRTDGFVFAKITPTVSPISESETDVSITVKIVESRQIRIGTLKLTGNQRFSEDEIRDELGLKQGKLFTEAALTRGIERVQTLYSEHGYPKVEIEPKDIELSQETATVDFQLHIREGSQIQIGKVKVSGLQKTKTEVVLREIPVKPNQCFDQRNIDTSYRRLRNLGYFYQISPNVLEAGETADKINFHAQVTEAKTGRLSGVVGYAPPDAEVDAAPQLTGILEANETNLLGTGRQFNLYWKSGLLRIFRISYAEPWVFGKPVTIGIDYGQLKQQRLDREQFTGFPPNDSGTVAEERSSSISAITNFGRVFEGALTLGYKQINVPNTGLPPTTLTPLEAQSPITTPSTELQPYSGTKYSLTFRLTRDTRDYFLNPTRGRRDSIAFEVSRSDFRLRKAWLSLQQYFPTWRKQTVAVELHGAAAWGVNIPPTELFYLGGATTLRGYDEDWFSGPRRVYANIEYRYLVGPDSQIFVFTDLGAVTLMETPSVFDRLRVGYGFGARLESRGGILRLNYGLAAGDSLLRGKIHVSLGASF
ncbi:MAG: BamA/TamA family outer membrane protein [Candidatus Poribacteria bacterium]|nr:BamA/TamA family outer membrane protein [Candidatus Poribacteria bacterium]